MKKLALLITLFKFIAIVSYAQVKPNSPPKQADDENKMVQFDGSEKHADQKIGQVVCGVMDTRIEEIFSVQKGPPNMEAWNKAHPTMPTYPFIPKTPILLGVKLGGGENSYSISYVKISSKSYVAYNLDSKDSVNVVAVGINLANVKDYRFRVVEGRDTILVRWTTPQLKQLYGAKQAYGYLGRYYVPGKRIRVEVVNIKNRELEDRIIFDWGVHKKRAPSRTTAPQPQEDHAFGHNIIFDEVSTDVRVMVRQPSSRAVPDTEAYLIMQDRNSNDLRENVTPHSPILLGVKLNPKLTNYHSGNVKSISKEFTSYVISDGSDATLIAMGINEANKKDFRYHVVRDDSTEIVPWSPVTKMEQKYGAKKPYAALGTFNARGSQILVEVVNVKNYSIRDGIIFDFRKQFRPFVTQIVVETTIDITHGDKNFAGTPNEFFNLNYRNLNHGYATRFDAATGLPLDMKFPVSSINDIMFGFKSHETIPYSVYLIRHISRKTDTLSLDYWNISDRYLLDSKNFALPGKYELIIQRAQRLGFWGKDQAIRMPFEVLQPPVKMVSISKIVVVLFIGLLVLLLLSFVLNNLYHKRRLKKAHQQKEMAALKLNSVRSQLNPHFMFNALTSIQNLMNQNDNDGANNYLSKFANLTREVLNASGRELISLEDELNMIGDYLEMEQLRFGFKYNINVDADINTANTEIPAMLVQPFIENAAKHGVSVLQGNGKIDVNIAKQARNLVLSIEDNGAGFNEKVKADGFGLKLSDQRIDLLNQVYKNQPIALKIDSHGGGTKITITLTNWID